MKFLIPTNLPTEIILTNFDKALGKILWIITLVLFTSYIYLMLPFFSNNILDAEWEPEGWYMLILLVTIISLWISICYQSWIDKSYDLDKDG